jgi:hypothetical protein
MIILEANQIRVMIILLLNQNQWRNEYKCHETLYWFPYLTWLPYFQFSLATTFSIFLPFSPSLILYALIMPQLRGKPKRVPIWY